MHARIIISLISGVALSGCATLPGFRSPLVHDVPTEGVPKASAVVDHVQCELVKFITDNRTTFTQAKLVAAVNLLIEVTDDGGINPSVAFIKPFEAEGTNRSLGFSAEYQNSAHRTFNQTFTVLLDPTNAKICTEDAKKPSGIRGDLGIAQVLTEGLKHSKGTDFRLPLAEDKGATVSDPTVPTFGSTIDFTITYGAGINPVWTLTKFTGPSGDAGLFGTKRTSKDTVILSFAQEAEVSDTLTAAKATEEATRAAKSNLDRMILLNLLGR